METTVNNQVPKTMKTFTIIWAGQLVSILGSGLTNFALGVWIFDQTGQGTGGRFPFPGGIVVIVTATLLSNKYAVSIWLRIIRIPSQRDIRSVGK